MSRPEIPKISAKDLERRRIAVDAQRTLLQQRLRDTAGLDELTDVFPAQQAVLHPTRKRKDAQAELMTEDRHGCHFYR